MKKLMALPLLVLLAACGPYRPLGYCETDGLFYYRLQGNVLSMTPQEVIDQGFDPYAYGEYCPGGTPTPTDPPPTATATNVPPTPTETQVAPSPTPTTVPPTHTATPGAPTPTLEPEEAGPQPLFKMWLLTRGNEHCLLISDTHPSVGRQAQACFPNIYFAWEAYNAPCAAYVYDNDTWACDKYTPHRLPLDQLMGVWERHLGKVNDR